MDAPESLSVVIPAYNEERFIAQLVAKVLAVDLSAFGLRKQVIVVDDGSKDRTAEIAGAIAGVTLLKMPRNSGKGAAVRAGIARADGDLVMIQDADLEYEPDDYRPMIEELLRSGADAVYGSRYMAASGSGAGKHEGQSWTAYLGGRSLSVVQWWFTGQYLTDTVTALKLFRAPVITPLELRTNGFELDHEITAKILGRGHVIREVPIRYHPRSKAEGKKIGFRDWLIAIRTYVRYSRARLLGLARTRARFIMVLVPAALAIALTATQCDRVSRGLWPPPPAANVVHPPAGSIYQIAPNLYVIPDGGGNTAVFVTTRGVVLVDPKYPENGAGVIAQVRTVTDRPITHVISTHAHSDHFGGVAAIPPAATVVLQERTANNIARLRGTGDPKSLDGHAVVTFRDKLTLFDGADAVDLCYFGAAHTDGDTFVVFRSAGIMHAGDVFAGKGSPTINLPWGGSPQEYPKTIARAIAGVGPVARVITGHGDVVGWQDFVDYGEFNQLLLDHVVAEMAAGHDWNVARRNLQLPAKFQQYELTRLINTFHDMYKGLTPWWRFW